MSDLAGQQFGGFRVTRRASARDRVRFWELACLGCGLIKEEMQVSLKQGFVPECGGCGDASSETPDPFAYEEDVAPTIAALSDDPNWPWPWRDPRLDDATHGQRNPPTPDEAAADLYARIDARIEAERVEREVLVEVAADVNGDTAEIVADLSLVVDDPDPFASTEYDFGQARYEEAWAADAVGTPTIIECDEPEAYDAFDPEDESEPAMVERLAEFLNRPSPWSSDPNPIADAVDGIAVALAALAKALRG